MLAPKVAILSFFLSLPSLAGVKAYTGPAAEKLFIEETGKEAFVKFEGPESKWAGKVIRVKKESGPSRDSYTFDYELELSDGKHKRSYQLVVESGYELVKGSRVRTVHLYFPEGDARKPLKLNHDAELTKDSQKIGLSAEAKKHPFSPVVD